MPAETKKENISENGILQSLPVPILIFDRKNICYANSQALQLLGINKKDSDQLFKKSILDLVEANNKNKLEEYIKKILKDGNAGSLSTELIVKGNKKQTIQLVSNTVIFENKGRIQSVLVPVEPTQQDQTLKEISDYSPDVIFRMEFKPAARITYISESCFEVLGFTKEEIYKNPNIIEPYLHAEDKKLAISSEDEYLRLASEMKENKTQARFKNKKGEIKFLEVIANPTFNSHRQLTGIVGSIRDVSDRMLTEELLIETKSKFELITNYGNDIITFYTYLPGDRYIYVSPNIEKILGYKPEELLRDPFFFSNRLLSDKAAFLEGELEMSVCQTKGIYKNYKHVYKTVNSKGEEIWLENTSTPIKNRKGKLGFYLNILKDVTAEKIKELEIEKQYINYRELLDNSPAAYIIHDKGKVLYGNIQLQSL